MSYDTIFRLSQSPSPQLSGRRHSPELELSERSSSPSFRPSQRLYEQSFELNTRRNDTFSAYLSHPIGEYSGEALEFLDSQPRDTLPSRSSLPGAREASKDRVRYTTGYPGTRFGNVTEWGSGPSKPADDYDPYRSHASNANDYIRGRYRQEYLDSPMGRGSAYYHSAHDAAKDAATATRKFITETPLVNRELRRASPDVFTKAHKDAMFQTRGWHGDALEHFSATESRFTDALEARIGFQRDYVGYDSYTGYKGHQQEIEEMKTCRDGYSTSVGQYKTAYDLPYDPPI